MACNCEGKKYNIGMGCCQLVLAPIENYYTKWQVDDLIESATTSGCCITPEEVDEKIESAKTEIEAEIPSLSGYATEQWVLDKNYITGVDLSNYATKSEIPTVPTSNTAFTNDAGYLTEHQSLTAYSTTNEVNTLINQAVSGKQDTLSAGTNITIVDNVISATGGGSGVTSGEVQTMIDNATSGLQQTLTAGTNVQINNNIISATDTKYTAGDNITISNQNVISTVTKFWCGTEAQWAQISGNTDANTIYLIH